MICFLIFLIIVGEEEPAPVTSLPSFSEEENNNKKRKYQAILTGGYDAISQLDQDVTKRKKNDNMFAPRTSAGSSLNKNFEKLNVVHKE